MQQSQINLHWRIRKQYNFHIATQNISNPGSLQTIDMMASTNNNRSWLTHKAKYK